MQDSVWFRTLSAEQTQALAASDEPPARAEVVIVGAGLIGLSTAFYLTEAGLRDIVILDRKGPLGEASGANAGGLWYGHESPGAGPLEGLAKLSSRLYQDWAERFPCDLTRRGVLDLLYDDADLERGRSAVEAMVRAGYQGDLLTPEEVRREEPELAVEAAAVRTAGDGQLHPAKLAAGLTAELRRRGVRLCGGQDVRTIGATVATDKARIAAGATVLAAGAWTPLLTAALGWEPPIRPMRGTLLALPAGPRRLRHTVMARRYYYWQLEDGPVAGGGSEDDVRFERGVDPATVETIRRELNAHFPSLASEATACAWSGFRPFCADLRPLIGPAPDQQNLFVAAGHFRKGVSLAPATGKALADVMLHGRCQEADLTAVSPARFKRNFRLLWPRACSGP
ncbi:MAG: FAD-dependent oxidoreductase [Acidobacteria bacterium]|nr:FAD-dependent oxidoreductase [Acidobacteriota bacterium]